MKTGTRAKVSVGIHVVRSAVSLDDLMSNVEAVDEDRFHLGTLPDRDVLLVWGVDDDPAAELANNATAAVMATGGEVIG